ncbi:uncharacterized protein RJT21DRAFT_120711 [Scheffersomyces amazonensis]|uniref:uncharacterized protein n=1 Tax=Scheffersomyces amazonensis TaxID=1078765 RepID=UPI00315DDD09
MTEKSSIYPALEEVKQQLAPKQLEILKNQVESEKPNVSSQTLFNYAWGLIKSNHYKDQKEGVHILTNVFRDDPSLRRECLYYLSLGSYKIGDYSNAKRYVETLLDGEPDNSQAKTLKETIDDRITTEGLIGIGIVGGALAIGIGLIGALVRKKR